MSNSSRMPKPDYFRMRYQDAVDKGLQKKAQYYRSRLEQMGEPIAEKVGKLGVTKHTFANGIEMFSF